MDDQTFGELSFFVSGIPVAKARAVVTKTHAYTPGKTAEWEDRVRWAARRAAGPKWAPTSAPCSVSIWLRGLSNRADIDNAAKAILDALNGVAWDDDRRVWRLHVERDEAMEKDGARVVVRRDAAAPPPARKPRKARVRS